MRVAPMKRVTANKLLGDTAAVTALLDRMLHHAHVLKCGPKSWRTQRPGTSRTNQPALATNE